MVQSEAFLVPKTLKSISGTSYADIVRANPMTFSSTMKSNKIRVAKCEHQRYTQRYLTDTESFVCAMSQAKRITRLRSYQCRWGDTDLLKRVKAWEAGRATSAATSFFEPMPLGDLGEIFVDGALGANNPVAELWDEAKEIWSGQPLEQQLGYVLSLGTGVPQLQAFSQSLKAVGRTILQLATSAENIEKDFSRNNKDLALNGRYTRLNVLRGLESIGGQ